MYKKYIIDSSTYTFTILDIVEEDIYKHAGKMNQKMIIIVFETLIFK